MSLLLLFKIKFRFLRAIFLLLRYQVKKQCYNKSNELSLCPNNSKIIFHSIFPKRTLAQPMRNDFSNNQLINSFK